MTALTMMVQADQEKGGRQTRLNCLVNFPSNLSDMMISGYLMYTTHCMYLCAVTAFRSDPWGNRKLTSVGFVMELSQVVARYIFLS